MLQASRRRLEAFIAIVTKIESYPYFARGANIAGMTIECEDGKPVVDFHGPPDYETDAIAFNVRLLSHTAVITPTLAAVLDMLRSAQRAARELQPEDDLPGTCYPFGNEIGERVGNIQTAWRLTCKRASISGLHFHDLLREAGSRLHETPGVSLTDVRDYLGHRDVGQTNKYLATSTQRLRAALVKRDEARTNLAQPPITQNTSEQTTSVTH